jgi:HK97 gp10 family phage protein
LPFVLGVFMNEIKITIEDNSTEVLKEMDKKVAEMLDGMGNELYKSIYNFMTEDKVVDTGRLRGSISYSTPFKDYKNPTLANTGNDYITGNKEPNTVVFGSNVEYASYVNCGTSKQRARKFMENGTYRAIPQIKKVVETILKGE